jgi:hypothetical protein
MERTARTYNDAEMAQKDKERPWNGILKPITQFRNEHSYNRVRWPGTCPGWKIRQSEKTGKLFFAPGNAGTSSIGKNLKIG